MTEYSPATSAGLPPALARAIADFAQHPLAHMHSSWLPGDWPIAYRKPGRYGHAARQVLAGPLAPPGDMEAMVDALTGMPGQGHAVAEPLARLVLMEPRALRLLAIWCGMAVHKEGFASERRGIARQLSNLGEAFAGPTPLAMRRVARRFDPQAVAFILKRVPDLPDIPMNLAPIRLRPIGAGRVMIERGYRLMCGLVAARSIVLLEAFRRKFPRRLARLPAAQLTPPQIRQLQELILLNLIPERFPSWHWLF
jgi:type III secretion protein K